MGWGIDSFENYLKSIARQGGEQGAAAQAELVEVQKSRNAMIHKAGNPEALIDWYNSGADGQIDWGSHGDFDACVAIAGEHMENPEGFCNLRHQDVTGAAPGHASGESNKAVKTDYENIISERKGEPADQELYSQVIREAKNKFDVYPSAVANGWVVQEYKRRGGRYKVTKSDTFSPPDGVRSAAKRALEWIADGKAGSGFTSVGRKRASDLSAGRSVSYDTVKRMKAYLDRHQPDKKATGFSQGEEGYPSPGRVAWDAWGGDAGYSWAEGIVGQKNKETKQ